MVIVVEIVLWQVLQSWIKIIRNRKSLERKYYYIDAFDGVFEKPIALVWNPKWDMLKHYITLNTSTSKHRQSDLFCRNIFYGRCLNYCFVQSYFYFFIFISCTVSGIKTRALCWQKLIKTENSINNAMFPSPPRMTEIHSWRGLHEQPNMRDYYVQHVTPRKNILPEWTSFTNYRHTQSICNLSASNVCRILQTNFWYCSLITTKCFSNIILSITVLENIQHAMFFNNFYSINNYETGTKNPPFSSCK